MRFDDRVVVVTGAGRGLGRAYALLLASLGARVVVNDLGGSMAGEGANAAFADEVVAEIRTDGGAAVADDSDISTSAGGAAVVQRALDEYGAIDAIINNAGIMRWGAPEDVDVDDLVAHVNVHAVGAFNTTRAAWPHFVSRGHGRVVMTTSTGVFGLPNNVSYAAAKGAVIGLTRSLAVAGAAHDIKVNAIAPAAQTRMAGPPRGDAETEMAPELVAPLAAYLAHEDCPVTGEIYTAGAGRFARLFIASTPGYVHAPGRPSIEDVAAHWEAINNETGYVVPADLVAWSGTFLAHLHQKADS